MREACAGFLFGAILSAILDVVVYFLALTRQGNVGPAGKEIVPIFLGWVGMGSRDLLDRGRTHKKNHDIGTWNIGT